MDLEVKIIIDVKNKTVRGFPVNIGLALNWIDQGRNMVIDWFIKAAMEGRMDEHGTAQEALVKPATGGLILPPIPGDDAKTS